jgi:hypothetical protein
MKFIFADSLDYVDPNFDFLGDRSSADRQPQWDDVYPHEILGYAPYDGVLVSRAIVGSHHLKGKYTPGQARRFEAMGARKFLRLDQPGLEHLPIFGDCGAFAYANQDIPPYTPVEIAEFYEDCGFTHGCSLDHIIFEHDAKAQGLSGGSETSRERFDITLTNAEVFLREVSASGANFTPLGAVQGWSPDSMAEAARRLVAMGYDYLALGGMVPLKAFEIRECLHAIRQVVPTSTRVHILGFAKADEIHTFKPYDVTSFDTTSPLLRAFKDAKQNFYLPGTGSSLRYYTALRVPQAIENPRLQRVVKRGLFRAEELCELEKQALGTLRAFDSGALEATLTYGAVLVEERPYADCSTSVSMKKLSQLYRTTLEEKPWKQCSCQVCTDSSIEVIIFRGSNRNKRRGIHNLCVYKNHIEKLDLSCAANDLDDLLSRSRAAER